jgi:transcriptional regulator with XRE-family HTH domain
MIATDDAKVRDFIFERRTALGMTQRQLAEAAHYNHVCVSRIETGTMVPRLDTLIALCKALGLEIEIREKGA